MDAFLVQAYRQCARETFNLTLTKHGDHADRHALTYVCAKVTPRQQHRGNAAFYDRGGTFPAKTFSG